LAGITVNHWNSDTEQMGICHSGELVEFSIKYPNSDRISNWTTITRADAHKIADWIKENIPEPPPAPPEWRVSDTGLDTVLECADASYDTGFAPLLWIRRDGSFDNGTEDFPSGVTPELHKEMICALLDAHYELHKGES